MTNTPKISEADLRQFCGGTEHYYRHGLNPHVVFTDGVKYVADEAGAYWLIDIIAISQGRRKELYAQPFQVWALAVQPNGSAILTVEDGNNNTLLRQVIVATDFPGVGITFWCSEGVIYLPVEH